MEAVILMDGTPISLSPAFSNLSFDVDGFVAAFDYQIIGKYKFYKSIDFKKAHRTKTNIEGYYKEVDYLAYIQASEVSEEQLEILMNEPSKFNYKDFIASVDNTLNIRIVDFGEPYNYYYKFKKYIFDVENTIDNFGPINYRIDFFKDLVKIGEGIRIPTGTPELIEDHNLNTSTTGHFFAKNFGDVLNLISDSDKYKFKRIITLMCFRINEIANEILPKILPDNITDNAANEIYNNTNQNAYYELSDLGKLIFDIKKSWGRYFNIGLDSMFSSPPNYSEYSAYNKALINFYFKCYQIQDIIASYPENIRLQYLLEVLPSSALSAIPIEYIIVALKNLINANRLDEKDQRYAVRLIIAVREQNADEFLDYLLERQNGVDTNFERLYTLLNDGRLERLTIVNWFVNEQTNRMYLAKAAYELWKVSKYDLTYVAPGVTPTLPSSNFVGVSPNNFFYLNQSELNLNNKLDIKKNGLLYEQSIDTFFLENKVKIKLTDHNSNFGDNGMGGVGIESEEPIIRFFESFHFYNPISIIGYQPNLELAIPLKSTIPAFLFHYIDEFDKIADFDAGISLVIDLTIDLLIIYFTGGVSILNDLKYLRYTTEIGTGMSGPITAINSVEVWRGISAGDQVFTMTAGALAQVNNYLITTTNDSAEREILLYAQKGFMCLLAIGVGRSLYSGYQASAYSKRVLDLIDALPQGAPIGLTAEHIVLLQNISGQTLVKASLFGNRLTNLNLGGVVNTFATKYINLFSDSKRMLFWKQFGNLSDETLALLNGGENGSYMINWLNLVEKNIIEHTDIFFFTKQTRVDRIIQFYDQVNLRPILEAFKVEQRVVFLDEFANISNVNFSKFVAKQQLINYWKRIYYDLALRSEFRLLGEDGMIKFIDRYGDISEESISLIRYNPTKHIKHLMEFVDATHDIAIFNVRRSEILPPSYIDADGVGLFRTHEVDSFIELELQFFGKIRASARNEAGDVIMFGGSLNGKSLDAMGIRNNVPGLIQQKGIQFYTNWLGDIDTGFLGSIKTHFEKIYVPRDGKPALDIVVIDYKYFDEISSAIGQPPNYFKNLIDSFISTNFSQYNNSTYLIKLNY